MNWAERVSPLVRSIPPSGIRRFFDIVAEMSGVISLGVGEPDFVTPWHIRESCVHGLQRGYTSLNNQTFFFVFLVLSQFFTLITLGHFFGKTMSTGRDVDLGYGK